MEGEHQGGCVVCGEEVKSASSNQENGETSSLLQSYLRGISCHFQEEINFGDLDVLVTCGSCSSKINSIQRGKEAFEGLGKGVSEIERNLHRKLTEMESVGQKVLSESKEIEKLIKNRIQKKDFRFGQEVVILKKGTEKASVVMKETMRELKGKRTCVKIWTCGVDERVEVASSSSAEGACGVITSVTSLATQNDDFEASEVFQVKTEQEQIDEEDDDNMSTGVPVPECVVKVEDEEIRTIRHRVIYGNRKVKKIPFEALPNTMLHNPLNHEGQSAEYEVIDLENEEAEPSNKLSGLREESAVGTERCEEGTMTTSNFKKRAIMEVDKDEREVQEEQIRQKISRQSVSPRSHKLTNMTRVSNESPNDGGAEYPDHTAPPLVPMQVGGASEEESAPEESSKDDEAEEMLVDAGEGDKHGNEENDTMFEKDEADKASACEEAELSRDENNTESHLGLRCEPNKSDEINNSMPVEETVIGKAAKTDTEMEENEKWFSGTMALCNSKDINVLTLRQRLQDIPKISSELFHKLVIKLKEVGKLEVLNDGNMLNLNAYGTISNPALYQIIKNVEVEQRTLDILFQAGVDFNILNNENQNVLFAAIEGNRSVFFVDNLITRGVNENQVNDKDQNLLFFAAKIGCSLEVFEFLVNKGVFLTKVSNAYETLFWDIWKSDGGAYQKRLCLLKAVVNTPDDRLDGEWALIEFINAGDQIKTAEEFHDLVQFISSKDKLGWFDNEEADKVTLHRALKKYEIGEEGFEMLVKAKCNFKKVDRCGYGSLHSAMFGGSCPWILKKLIEQGVDVKCTPYNTNLLQYAVSFVCGTREVSVETFKFLIEKGLDITALDSNGDTVLEIAVKYKSVNANILTSFFIWSFDAGLRHLSSTGASIVHYVAEYGSPAAMDYILGKSVNVNINEVDKNGFSLFEIAICSLNENAIENAKVLIKYGADPQFRKGERKTTLHHLSVLSDVDIPATLRFCLEELRLDANATDGNGMTPLFTIIYENFFHNYYVENDNVESQFEKLNILLENGADVNAKPNQDIFVNSSPHQYVEQLNLQAPLHLAFYAYLFNPASLSSPLEVVKLLLRSGANVNVTTLEGWTVIHLVIGWKKLDPATLVQFTDLFGDRMNYSAKTLKGQTALHLAAENRNIDSIRFCLEKGLDVNDLDEEGKTPLDYLLPRVGQKKAVVHVLLDAMQLLLENGATSETKQKVKDNIEGLWKTNGLTITGTAYLKLLAVFNDTIDFENEEADASKELPGFHEETGTSEFTEGCEEETVTIVTKRAIMEVDRDQTKVQVQETRHKICRPSGSPGSHKKGAIVEESLIGCDTEYSDHAAKSLIPMQVGGAGEEESAPEKSAIGEEEERTLVNAGEEDKHGSEENDITSEEDHKASSSNEDELSTNENETESPIKLPCNLNKSDEMNNSMPDEETVTGNPAKTDMKKEDNEKWFSGIMALCDSNDVKVKTLRQHLQNTPGISSDLFHQLVIKLKEVGKMEAFNNAQNVSGTYIKPALYQIIKNVEVEQRTLDIMFQADVNFNVLNTRKQNVLFAAIEGDRSVSFITNLITRGLNENHINGKGQNLLFFAADKGCSLEVFEFLVNKGVYLNGWDKIQNPYGTIFLDIWNSSGGDYQMRLCLLKALVNTRDDCHGKWALQNFLTVGDTIRTAEEFHDLVQFIFSSKDRFGWFDTEYEYGATLLHRALSTYVISEEAFEMLIKAQCNFKKVDKYGRGSLHFAMFGGSCPWILEKLIEQGVDVNMNSPRNENLLHCAFQFDCKVSLETLKFLIEKGLDITALDSDGYTVLEAAVGFKGVDANILTSIFIWSFDAGLRHLNKSYASIIQYAAEYGTPAALDYILAKSVNVDINKIVKQGLSLFETAVCSANENAIENAKVLIKYGADPQFKKGERKTTLHYLSVMSDTAAALRFCLEELRLDVNATDVNGMTPLFAIIYENFFVRDYLYNNSNESKYKKLNVLLENGADVNAKPKLNRNFPLHSFSHYYVETIRLQTPLHLALHRYLFNPNSQSSPLKLVELLLRNGANVNDPTLEGWTAIHIIIGWKNLDRPTLVQLTDLFGDRVDYSAKTRKGQTALHLAAENRNIDSIRFCLEKGLDVNDLDEEGKTPLDYLLPHVGQKKMGLHVLLDAMQLLLENGATSETKQKVKDNIEGL